MSFLVILMAFLFWYVVCITAFNKTKFTNDPEVKRVSLVQPLLYTSMFAYIFIVKTLIGTGFTVTKKFDAY